MTHSRPQPGTCPVTSPYPVPPAAEEPLGSVTRVLALSPVPAASEDQERADAFTAGSLPQLSGRVYGGQVVAQGLLAAAATVVPDEDGPRLPHSVHASFMRGGQPDEPIRFEVERLRDGRSFTQRRTTALQQGKAILSMITSFQETQPGTAVQLEAPEVPGPEELRSALEIFRTINHPVAKFLGRTAAFDLRHVEDNLYLRPAAERSGRQHLWARARGTVPSSASQTVHRALLAYMCDQIMLEPALRSQGLCWQTPQMSLATLDHAQWFHRDVDVNDWLLFVQDSPTSQGGRAMARAEVFSSTGQLVSTIAQEGMIRTPGPEATDQAGHGRWAIRLDDGAGADPHVG